MDDDYITRKKLERKLEEELEISSRLVAIRFFDKESKNTGARILLLKIDQYLAIGGGIRILREKDLELLDLAGLKYEKYELKSHSLIDVYRHFGVDIPTRT